MKKLLLFFISFFVINMSAGVVEDTGFYGVYVKSIPFWRFWNQIKAVRVIQTLPDWEKSSSDLIFYFINNHLPILLTWNYKEAEDLKNKLVALDCEIEIREIQFICNSEEETNMIETQLFFKRMLDEVNKELFTYENSDLDTERNIILKFLERETKREKNLDKAKNLEKDDKMDDSSETE